RSNSAPRLSRPRPTLASGKFSFKNVMYLSRGANSPPGRLAADAASLCQTAVVRGRQRARETKTLGVAMAAISFSDRGGGEPPSPVPAEGGCGGAGQRWPVPFGCGRVAVRLSHK